MDMRLVLEDGTEFLGHGFGADSPVAGEVVFNTGMAGYVETLTDPSYKGQLLVTTYPLIGNYGVPGPRITENIDPPYESNHIQVQGLIVQHYVDRYSHHAATRSLHEWLKADGIPAVSGIDTRNLTRRLREFGTMRGWLFAAELSLEQAQKTRNEIDMVHEVFHLVAPSAPIRYEGGDLTVMLVDIGAKDNIVRSLLARGVTQHGREQSHQHDYPQHHRPDHESPVTKNAPPQQRPRRGLNKFFRRGNRLGYGHGSSLCGGRVNPPGCADREIRSADPPVK